LKDEVYIMFEYGHYFTAEWCTLKAAVKQINESTEAVLGSFFFAEFCPQSVLLSQTGRLNFQKFDMNKVLASDTHLMASEGKEYDVEEEYQGRVSF
jgi:hypothetical protein